MCVCVDVPMYNKHTQWMVRRLLTKIAPNTVAEKPSITYCPFSFGLAMLGDEKNIR